MKCLAQKWCGQEREHDKSLDLSVLDSEQSQFSTQASSLKILAEHFFGIPGKRSLFTLFTQNWGTAFPVFDGHQACILILAEAKHYDILPGA